MPWNHIKTIWLPGRSACFLGNIGATDLKLGTNVPLGGIYLVLKFGCHATFISMATSDTMWSNIQIFDFVSPVARQPL